MMRVPPKTCAAPANCDVAERTKPSGLALSGVSQGWKERESGQRASGALRIS